MTRVGAVVSEVEARLREVWLPVDGEPNKARACTMNLLVVGAPDVVDRYQAIVDEVTSAIPARAILLALDPEGPDGLSSDVSAVCGVDGTCSERIILRASGAVSARVASVVDALRVPEMPTALVWLGRVHVGDPIFVGLAGDATRVVLDTEYTSISSLLSLTRWARTRVASMRESSRPPSMVPGGSLAPPGAAGTGTPYVADLAWTRLLSWQEMIARLFDDPGLVGHAARVRRLELRQAGEPGARLGTELTLLLGWLATRLDWKMARLGGHVRLSRADGEPIQLVLSSSPRPPQVAPLALTSVTLEAESGGVTLRGVVQRDLDTEPDVLVWRLAADGVPSATEQRVRLGANKGGRLLERTLHRAPYDAALVESAKFADEIGEELVCTG
ncbi:MAG: glucose-6-phosphate dehydrogenase assembly protein OpcA [Myxococcales bacterium]|nr:glucose-6-phosphate dehydrogenase assembly protein OpcA [Myxococcales bacterium]